MSGMTRTTPRVARKHHTCDCRAPIRPGERYLEHVAAPDAPDLGNSQWWRLAECAECATRRGRAHLLVEATSG